MAIRQHSMHDPAWASPVWPDQLPNAEVMKVVYGPLADELVIRFYGNRHFDTVVVPITTPDVDYVGVLSDFATGAVVGIHVYPLLAFAIERHPFWKPLAQVDPPPDSVALVVEDIRKLFDRYGIADPEAA